MSKELKWNKFPFYGDRLSGKDFTGINISRQHVRENHLSGIESSDKAPGCLEKLLSTNEWKNKIVLKLAPGA